MTSIPAPTPDPAPHSADEPRGLPEHTVAHLLDGAAAEIGHWQRTISELGEQYCAHPSINQIRFESASRATGPLDQLEAMLTDVLAAYGLRQRRPVRVSRSERPRRLRRWPVELAGVPESHLANGHLGRLSYAQLHALAMADHPDEIDDMARAWYIISRAAWTRGSRLYDAVHSRPQPDADLVRLADAYRAFAARTDHYGKTFVEAAQTHREARIQMEELGPP